MRPCASFRSAVESVGEAVEHLFDPGDHRLALTLERRVQERAATDELEQARITEPLPRRTRADEHLALAANDGAGQPIEAARRAGAADEALLTDQQVRLALDLPAGLAELVL